MCVKLLLGDLNPCFLRPQAFILVECLVKLDIDLITPYGIIVDSFLPTPIYIMNMVSSKHLLPKIEHNFFFFFEKKDST